MNQFSSRRRRRFGIALAATALVVASAAASQAATPLGSRALSGNGCRLTDVAANGRIAVVAFVGNAATDPGRRCGASAAVRIGTTWVPAQTLAPRGATDLAAAVGANGDAAVAWYDDGGRLRVAVRPAAGPRFGAAEIPPGSRSAQRTLRQRDPPGLAVDGAGTVYAVTEDFVVNVRSSAGAWTQDAGARQALNDMEVLPTLDGGDIARVGAAANARGDLVIGSVNIRQVGPREIALFAPRVVSRRAGGPWSVGLLASEVADRPAVGIDGRGAITVAWAANEPSTGVFRAEGQAGGELGRKIRVVDLSSTRPGAQGQVDIAVAESGAATIATMYGRGPTAAHRPPGGVWGTPTAVRGEGMGTTIDAAIDPRGAAAVMTGSNVFTHAAGPGRWSRAWRVGPIGQVGFGRIAVDAAARVAPAWETREGAGPIVTVLRPFLASDTRGNTRPRGNARMLSAVPLYPGGTPQRCRARAPAAVLRCAPRLAVRIRNDGPPQRAGVQVGGTVFDLTLRSGTRRYVFTILEAGRHRVALVIAGIPRDARTVRILGCPGPYC